MLKKILKYILAIAILCYLAFAFVIVPLQKDNDSCRGVSIQITNNRLGTISNDDIVDMLRDGELYPEGENFDSISCSRIEEYIKTLSLIKECQVYKTNGKKIRIDVICREPVLKVFDKTGATYYVDVEGQKIDDIKRPLLLPVASGEIDDSMIGKELKNIVLAIEKAPFWIAQIEQIYFNDRKEAIITPRMGDHTIELGSTKDIDKKLESIEAFYLKGLNTVGWDKYSKLNIKISNKVICTKREK